jgi:hypothetical protein
MDVTRIAEMESYLDACVAATHDLNAQLTRLDDQREAMIRLFRYYGSEAWYQDRAGELPADVKAGVLSEDLVYDAIVGLREAAFHMLELSTDILKNRG